jgi:hypothetical protein
VHEIERRSITHATHIHASQQASEETGGGAQEKACSAFQASGSARFPTNIVLFLGSLFGPIQILAC